MLSYGHNCIFRQPRTSTFTEKDLGFVDTHSLFNDIYPALKSNRQEILVFKCLGVTYSAHNSKQRVQSLCELVKKSSPSISEHTKFTSTTTSAVKRVVSTTSEKGNNR